MSAPNDGGPAFPNRVETVEDGEIVPMEARGMTLRDYFAAAAMQGWLASYGSDAAHPSTNDTHREEFARISYDLADAMLAARERKEGA